MASKQRKCCSNQFTHSLHITIFKRGPDCMPALAKQISCSRKRASYVHSMLCRRAFCAYSVCITFAAHIRHTHTHTHTLPTPHSAHTLHIHTHTRSTQSLLCVRRAVAISCVCSVCARLPDTAFRSDCTVDQSGSFSYARRAFSFPFELFTLSRHRHCRHSFV